MDNFSIIRYLIGASRVKFSVLDEIFKEIKISKNHVTMYVDAHAILYRLYRNNVISELQNLPTEIVVRDIVISFVNVLAHYRRYIATRLHKSNDIIVVFNRELPKYQKKYYSDYQHKLYEQYNPDHKDYGELTKVILQSYQFIRGMVPYFEGIYCLDNQGIDDSTLIADLIYGNENDTYNIIFSKNLFLSQLVANDCVQFVNARDKSYFITKNTVYKNGILKDKQTVANDKLTASMLPFLWCVAGCSDINLKKTDLISGVATMVRIMNQMVENKEIEDAMSFSYFSQALLKSEHFSKIKVKTLLKELENRYMITDLTITRKSITASQRAKLAADLYDLFDENGLEELNETLAQFDSEIELIELTSLNMNEVNIDYDGGW